MAALPAWGPQPVVPPGDVAGLDDWARPAIISAPDQDSDGVRDVAVLAPVLRGNETNEARVRFLSSKDGGTLHRVGIESANAGRVLAADRVGDLDRDGVLDLAVLVERPSGGPRAASEGLLSNQLLLLSGTTFREITEISGTISGDMIGVTSLSTRDADEQLVVCAGFRDLRAYGITRGMPEARYVQGIDGANATNIRIHSLPDVDGDGCEDIVVGIPAVLGPGRVRVLSGRTGAQLYMLDSACVEGGTESFGAAFAVIGDVNGDSVRDFVVGDPDERGIERGDGGGAVSAVSGKEGKLVWKADAPKRVLGFGLDIVSVSDVDGDGFTDCVVASHGPEGALVVVSGADGAVRRSIAFDGDAWISNCCLRSADVDGDNIADVLVCGRLRGDRRSRGAWQAVCVGGADWSVDWRVRFDE